MTCRASRVEKAVDEVGLSGPGSYLESVRSAHWHGDNVDVSV